MSGLGVSVCFHFCIAFSCLLHVCVCVRACTCVCLCTCVGDERAVNYILLLLHLKTHNAQFSRLAVERESLHSNNDISEYWLLVSAVWFVHRDIILVYIWSKGTESLCLIGIREQNPCSFRAEWVLRSHPWSICHSWRALTFPLSLSCCWVSSPLSPSTVLAVVTDRLMELTDCRSLSSSWKLKAVCIIFLVLHWLSIFRFLLVNQTTSLA